MSKYIYEMVLTEPNEHPAVKALRKIRPEFGWIESLEVLKKRKGQKSGGKSSVYRLKSAESPNPAIIAKYSRWQSIAYEQNIYQCVLPNVPVGALNCYGALQDEGSDYGWLFMEEAEGGWFSEDNPAHLSAAAVWLGTLHTATSALDLANVLPDHGLERYNFCLNRARSTILLYWDNSSLSNDDRACLEDVLQHLDQVEALWPTFEHIYSIMPKCLVHGDFVGKNVRVRPGTDVELLVLDWDIAGWGVPAVDLEFLDECAYWSVISTSWAEVSPENIRDMKAIGIILRNLGLIQATSCGLEFEWIERTMDAIMHYDRSLATALNTLGIYSLSRSNS